MSNDRPNGKPILCLDFDGVIHSYTSGWKGPDVIPDPPVPGAIAFIKEALEHFDVQIYSSRSKYPRAIDAMKTWLCEHGLNLSGLGVQFPTEKPPAFLTIDDRAMRFEGVFPNPKDLLDSKPWNKKCPPTLTSAILKQIRPWSPTEKNPDHE